MANEKPKLKEVVYKFQKANDYRIIYVNGVWGGMNFPNEIRMELINDIAANPDLVIHEATSEGVGKEIKRIPEFDGHTLTVIREIQVLAIMSPAVAEYIGNWLLDIVKQTKEQSK